MRKYTLYPDALERLESSGLAAKIRKVVAKDGGISGVYISGQEVRGIAKEMDENGVFEPIPLEERKRFKESLGDAFSFPDKHLWTMKKQDGSVIKERYEVEDFLGFMGYYAASILKPKKLWAFSKLGFQSLTDLCGSISALMANESAAGISGDGYKWETKTPEGKIRSTQITGDMNSDLRIFQIDRTPYETIDPLGNPVSYRPVLDSDEANVLAYHSTELALLAAVIKWVNQHKIHSEALENKASSAIEWARSLGQHDGTATHSYSDGDLSPIRRAFFRGNSPLALIDETNLDANNPFDFLGTNRGVVYGMYTNDLKELVFLQHPTDSGNGLEKMVTARFSPSDADHLFKGIVYQAAKGLGRTSAAQIILALQYRFSPQYEEFMK